MRRRAREFEDAEIRMEEWGEWMAKPIAGLGYPSRTVEGRMMEEGAGASIRDTSGEMWAPKYNGSRRCAAANRAFADLPKDWQTVIYVWFVERKRGDAAANAAKLSRQRYNERWRQAMAFLTGRLGYALRY